MKDKYRDAIVKTVTALFLGKSFPLDVVERPANQALKGRRVILPSRRVCTTDNLQEILNHWPKVEMKEPVPPDTSLNNRHSRLLSGLQKRTQRVVMASLGFKVKKKSVSDLASELSISRSTVRSIFRKGLWLVSAEWRTKPLLPFSKSDRALLKLVKRVDAALRQESIKRYQLHVDRETKRLREQREIHQKRLESVKHLVKNARKNYPKWLGKFNAEECAEFYLRNPDIEASFSGFKAA